MLTMRKVHENTKNNEKEFSTTIESKKSLCLNYY